MGDTSLLQQQITELSFALSETVNSLKVAEANVMVLETEKRRNELTMNEVNRYEDDRHFYRPVGRAYVKMDKPQMMQILDRELARNQVELAENRTKFETYSRKRDEVSNNIRELVESARQ